jgi:hypothetical protein
MTGSTGRVREGAKRARSARHHRKLNPHGLFIWQTRILW